MVNRFADAISRTWGARDFLAAKKVVDSFKVLFRLYKVAFGVLPSGEQFAGSTYQCE